MSTKELHYWAQLRLALTSGQWSAKYPARTPNGIALPWSELLRKFNKHCKGFRDVAEVASYTQALALLLAANSSDEDQDDQPSDTEYPLELGQECMLAEERLEEGRAGYDVLKGLNSSNYDSLHFALAYYAYALGDSEKCLAHLANVPELLSLQNHIPSGSDAATTSTTTSHSLGVHVPTFSTTQSFSSGGGSFVTMADASAPEIRDGRAWALTETFRSICLKGFCQEKLDPSNPRAVLTAYCASLPLFATLATMFSNSTSSTSNLPLNTKIFSQDRELWRWVERLLWRAIIVSSAISQEATPIPCEDVWTWLRHYSACSIYWPATFRTWHRSTISVIYLRATIIQHHPIHSLSPPPRKTENEKPWLHAARIVVNDYRAILGACSSFPSAGERNVRVEDFVDLCVGVWEAAGASGTGAGWVLDVLWWATRLTFNSHKVLRHMTRILHVSGDTKLARRTLLLYSQVVGKAYEAGQAPSSSTPDLDDVQDPEGAAADSDSDSDEEWVETLVYGARMLCRWAVAQPGIEGLKEAREAGVYIKKARARLRADNPDGIRLAARVDLAEGVWNFVMTLKEQDPHTRPGRLAAAHTFFLQACFPNPDAEDGSEFIPDPAALYHLSLSFAHRGPTHDVKQALLFAGRAVEGDPKEIRYWHLFGLLLAAAEKWEEARDILESGAAISDEESPDVDTDNNVVVNETLEPQGPENTTRVQEKDFAVSVPAEDAEHNSQSADIPPLSNGHINAPAPQPEGLKRIPLIIGTRIPPARELFAPVQDHPSPSKEDMFEHALQLRMTQGVLAEVMDGPEGAEEKWVEIFSWVAAQRTPSVTQLTPRPSVEGSQTITETAPSTVASNNNDVTIIYSPAQEVNEKQDTLEPIPITISPATPVGDTSALEKRGSTMTKRSSSSIDRDTSKSKKMQQMLKNRVHQGRARVTTISRKIGHGVVRSGTLKRANSTPDFHAILRQTAYQASSIHSRRRISSFLNNPDDRTPTASPPPPLPDPPPPPPQERKSNWQTTHRDRLIADLWLMSASTFRRLGKIEQAKGAIQEAEVKDEDNPRVWVQLGLYYAAHQQHQQAMDAYQKALFIDPDDVSASVHFAGLLLNKHEAEAEADISPGTSSSNYVDLVAGMLGHLTRGNGWHVPEAWYYLAKAHGLQGRKRRERECLDFALALSANRGIREIGAAIGWCI